MNRIGDARNHSPTVHVFVYGGCVQHYIVPPGVLLEIHDYDNEPDGPTPEEIEKATIYRRRAATPAEIEDARAYYENDEIEIDDDALASDCAPTPNDTGEQFGRWIQAWVWLNEGEGR